MPFLWRPCGPLSVAHEYAAQAALGAEGELVTPPASAQVEKWYTADGIFMVNTLAGLQDFTSLMSASMVRR